MLREEQNAPSGEPGTSEAGQSSPTKNESALRGGQSPAHRRTQKRLYEFHLDTITKKRQEEIEDDILCMIVNKGVQRLSVSARRIG